MILTLDPECNEKLFRKPKGFQTTQKKEKIKIKTNMTIINLMITIN